MVKIETGRISCLITYDRMYADLPDGGAIMTKELIQYRTNQQDTQKNEACQYWTGGATDLRRGHDDNGIPKRVGKGMKEEDKERKL